MGNYSLVINSKFNPFSYQDMLAPVLMATQAHQELENQYGELEAKADIWENLANEQTDPYAYKMYKTFANDLEEKAELLAKEGLNVSSRKNMLNMRARYNKEITPIETAYKRREELAAEQRKLSASNPTMFYQRKASSMSLDDLIRNPSMDYGERYSGALLAEQVGQMAANLKTALTGKGNLKGIGLPYQYEQLLQYGYTPEQIQQAITKPQEGNPVLNTIVEQALAASGMKNWASPEQLAQARAYANQGLYNAIGKTEFRNFTDEYSKQDALNARQHARTVAAQRDAERRAEQQSLKMYNINPTSLYGDSEVSAKNKDTLDLLTKFRNKGYFNAQGQLTKKGVEALQAAKRVTKYQRGPTGYVETTNLIGDVEFKNWALKHGHSQKGIDAGYSSPTLNRYYQDTMARINRGELVIGTPNIDVYRQRIKYETTQRYLLNQVTAALAGGNIYKVGSLTYSENGLTMGRGEAMSANDFKTLAIDNPILYVMNSPTTDNQLIELSNGEKFIMPGGMLDNINQTDLSTANQRIMNSASLQERAVNLNQANSYLGALLDYNEGTGVKTSDGTIIF